MMALVLSGGGGARLSVLTSERAVSAIPFGGKYRIIDFVLSNCCHSQIQQVGVLAQHAPASLYDHIGAGRPWDLDRRGGGVVILQPFLTRNTAGWYRGTADAIAQNWDEIVERGCDRVLVLSGDHVYRMDYRALVQTHDQHRAAATLAVTRVPPDQSRRFGMATIGDDGRVLALEEKPERASTPFASMGVYLFESEVLHELLRGRPVDLVLDVLRPMLAAGERVFAHAFNGYWEDVGTVGSYYRANLDLLAAEPRLSLDDQRWPILTRDEERPPVLIRDGAEIEQSLIANGCRVAGRVRRSVLFPGVIVEPGAEITDAVVMQDVRVSRGSRITRAILDKYARIGEGAEIGAAHAVASSEAYPELSWLEGLALVGKDAIVPPDSRVAGPAVVGVGAVPSDFPDGGLSAGSHIPNRTWYEDRP